MTSSKEYYLANRERHLAYMRAYYQAHKKERKEFQRAYRLANPDKVKANNKRLYRKPTRAQILKSKYGITEQDRTLLFETSDGLCAMCYERPAVQIDHDHKTGQLRGALCRNCNTGLGFLGDDMEGLVRAMEYLGSVGTLAADGSTAKG